jgi:hypothetical protein
MTDEHLEGYREMVEGIDWKAMYDAALEVAKERHRWTCELVGKEPKAGAVEEMLAAKLKEKR